MIAGDPRFAKELYVVACARSGPHTGPVGISRDHGPWNCKNPLLLAIAAAATYREKLALATAASDAELDLAFCATMAMAVDQRDSTCRDDQAALRERAEQRLSPPPPVGATMRAGTVNHFDYRAFFRAAGRDVTKRALREVGGIAMETDNAWRDAEGLAQVAATVGARRPMAPGIPRRAAAVVARIASRAAAASRTRGGRAMMALWFCLAPMVAWHIVAAFLDTTCGRWGLP